MFFRSSLVLLLLSAALAWTPDAVAQSLVILDCQGITRAIHEARGAQASRVEVQVSESSGAPSNGSQVQLTNNVTGQVYTAETQSGTAVFGSVPPGNYSMALIGSDLTVGTITIGSAGLGIAAASGVLAGGALVGGGAVAGGASAVNSISGGNNDPEPTPTPTPIPNATQTPIPSSSPTAAPTPTATPCDCDPDAEPTPVDDFFDNQPTPPAGKARALSPYR